MASRKVVAIQPFLGALNTAVPHGDGAMAYASALARQAHPSNGAGKIRKVTQMGNIGRMRDVTKIRTATKIRKASKIREEDRVLATRLRLAGAGAE